MATFRHKVISDLYYMYVYFFFKYYMAQLTSFSIIVQSSQFLQLQSYHESHTLGVIQLIMSRALSTD